MSPSITKENLTAVLQWIRDASSGPTVVLGDFNARHKDWDSTTNTRGRTLRKWSKRFGWTISAPNTPTNTTEQGTSTIDLVLSKGLKVSKPQVYHGKWSGASDHSPVVVFSALSREEKTERSFTPISVRKDKELAKKQLKHTEEQFQGP